MDNGLDMDHNRDRVRQRQCQLASQSAQELMQIRSQVHLLPIKASSCIFTPQTRQLRQVCTLSLNVSLCGCSATVQKLARSVHLRTGNRCLWNPAADCFPLADLNLEKSEVEKYILGASRRAENAGRLKHLALYALLLLASLAIVALLPPAQICTNLGSIELIT